MSAKVAGVEEQVSLKWAEEFAMEYHEVLKDLPERIEQDIKSAVWWAKGKETKENIIKIVKELKKEIVQAYRRFDNKESFRDYSFAQALKELLWEGFEKETIEKYINLANKLNYAAFEHITYVLPSLISAEKENDGKFVDVNTFLNAYIQNIDKINDLAKRFSKIKWKGITLERTFAKMLEIAASEGVDMGLFLETAEKVMEIEDNEAVEKFLWIPDVRNKEAIEEYLKTAGKIKDAKELKYFAMWFNDLKKRTEYAREYREKIERIHEIKEKAEEIDKSLTKYFYLDLGEYFMNKNELEGYLKGWEEKMTIIKMFANTVKKSKLKEAILKHVSTAIMLEALDKYVEAWVKNEKDAYELIKSKRARGDLKEAILDDLAASAMDGKEKMKQRINELSKYTKEQLEMGYNREFEVVENGVIFGLGLSA